MPKTVVISVVLALSACGVALSTASAAAAPSGKARLTLTTHSRVMKSLRAQGVNVRAVAPARGDRTRLTFPLAGVEDGPALTLVYRGGLRLTNGPRSAVVRGFRVTLGRRAALSVRLGRLRAKGLAFASGRPAVNRERGTARLLGVRLGLTRKGALAVRRELGLQRLPAGTLARASFRAGFEGRPETPAPTQPGPTPQPAPAPEPAPPALSTTVWESSHLPGCSSCDLKSFIKYILGGPPGSGVGASVTPAGGADWLHPQRHPARDFDYTLPAVSSSTAGGVTTVEHTGEIRYHKPQHFLDNRIRNLEFEIPSVGTAGRVLADGQHTARFDPSQAPVPYADEHVMNLDLSGVTPTPVPGGLVYREVPATVAETGQDELGYETGRPWGRFTITVPVR